jgi:hypothetical protein
MATVPSPTYPGTQFSLKAEHVQIGPGSVAYELFAAAHSSGVASRPKRYKDIGEILTALTEATDVDAEKIQMFTRTLAKRGFAEIAEVWLLDEQAARFGIHISRLERHRQRIR